MHSRLLPAPILAPAKGAGPPRQRPLCDPDPQARRLQARRGSGPGDGPVARQPLGGVVGDAEAVAGPATACPPRRARHSPALPAAAPNFLRVRPKTPPTATGSQPHCAHSMMGLASSPRHHLRPSTAHYVARRSALHLRHFSALATRCTSLFYPQDPNFSPPSRGHFSLAERRISSW